MSASHFTFKQFTIRQERCAMKVGTDGALLGAWADVMSTRRQPHKPAHILDVGTGTGLIALMAAQRNPDARILAIDIDPDAVRQAQENVGASPFARRIVVRQADFRESALLHDEKDGALFNAILCNPPYFENALRSPDASRSTARHSDTLTLDDLALSASSLLRPSGTLSVILPFERRRDMTVACATRGLRLTRETHVRTLPDKPPKRVLLEFSTTHPDNPDNPEIPENPENPEFPEFPVPSTLTIESFPGLPTLEFKALLKDFYIKF